MFDLNKVNESLVVDCKRGTFDRKSVNSTEKEDERRPQGCYINISEEATSMK